MDTNMQRAWAAHGVQAAQNPDFMYDILAPHFLRLDPALYDVAVLIAGAAGGLEVKTRCEDIVKYTCRPAVC